LKTVIKNQRMLKGEPFRGRIRQLSVFAVLTKKTLRAAAVEIRMRKACDGPRYEVFGYFGTLRTADAIKAKALF
jgi:hypothetical protein